MRRRTTGITVEPVQAPIAIMDPSNTSMIERAGERELPFNGAEPPFHDHYHGSNAVTGKWKESHFEHGHDPNHPVNKPKKW
jgi:glutamate transport system permease protein